MKEIKKTQIEPTEQKNTSLNENRLRRIKNVD